MNCSSFEPETCQQNSPIARGRFQRLSGFATHLFLGLVRVKVAGNSSRVWRPRGFACTPSVRSDERTHDWSSSSDSARFVFIINIVSFNGLSFTVSDLQRVEVASCLAVRKA